MKGSAIKNIKFNSNKQKLSPCVVCGKELVVGKFAGTKHTCEVCKNIPKGKISINKEPVKLVKGAGKQSIFAAKFTEMANKLGFEVNNKRLWCKKYAIDGGGVAIVHLMLDQGIQNEEKHLDYFSLTIQRAISISENFRQFMPAEAASDCEVLASEFGDKELIKHEIGKEICSKCGAITSEFAVDTKQGRILCLRPNSCWKKYMNNSGAEAHE